KYETRLYAVGSEIPHIFPVRDFGERRRDASQKWPINFKSKIVIIKETTTDPSSIEDNSLETNEPIPPSDNSANRRNLPSGPQKLFKLDLQFFSNFSKSNSKSKKKRLKEQREEELKNNLDKIEGDLIDKGIRGNKVLNENNKILKEENSALEKEIEELKRAIEDDDAQITYLTKTTTEEIEAKKSQINELLRELAGIHNKYDIEIREVVAVKEREIKLLQGELDESRAANETWEFQAAALVNKNNEAAEALNNKLIEKNAEIEKKDEKIADLRKEIAKLKKDNKELSEEKENEELRKKNDNRKAESAAAEKLFKEQEEKLKELTEENENLKAKNKELEKDVTSLKFKTRATSRPSLSSRTSSMRRNSFSESRPSSRADSFIGIGNFEDIGFKDPYC
ncbi:30269_t:CDS:2, partial [Racocetra persica]